MPTFKRFLSAPGNRTFLWLTSGQTISMLGSSLTAFALGVWLFQETGQATPLALSMLFNYLPKVLLKPLAGVVVDRINRKEALLWSDLGQAMVTGILLLLIQQQLATLELIYALLAVSSTISTLQAPAEQATVTLLLPKQHYGRAYGLLSLGESIGSISAPILAGLLVPVIGVSGVMWIDVATFLTNAFILIKLKIPAPANDDAPSRLPYWSDLATGWQFIFQRPGLRNLVALFACFQISSMFVTTRLVTPLVLARTDGDTLALGMVFSAFSLGQLAGGGMMSTWGGPRRKLHGILGGMLLIGLLNQVLFGLSGHVALWALAYTIGGALTPIQAGSSRALWQTKVPAPLQGRVFATRGFLTQLTLPLGLVLIGPLADQVLRPFLATPLGRALGGWLGPAAGREFALIFVLFGFFTVLIALVGYLNARVRLLEDELPDSDA